MSQSNVGAAAPVRSKWTINQRIRYIGKPLIFASAVVPAIVLLLRTFEVVGTLGANPVEELLHECGIWALRFLIVTLCITPLRFVLGKPWVLQFRRMLGLFAFFYAFLHLNIYLWLDQGFALQPIIEDVFTRPYITLGMLAFTILLALAVTSPHRARRSLGKTWQNIHYLIYPAAILAVWHFWWQVKKDITEPLVYAAILGTLLGYRLWKRARKKARKK